MKIAIIGAGLSGLVLAKRLNETHSVTVLEKARGPGGRMSTRRAPPFTFDHGAQYFTAETAPFQAFIQDLHSQDLIGDWPDEIQLVGNAFVSRKRKYVAQPGMNAICKHLASGLDIRTQMQVDALERMPGGWRLVMKSGDNSEPFDWVISTAPSIQTAALMPKAFNGHAVLDEVRMLGCYALMLGYDHPIKLDFSALKSDIPPVGWIAVNSQKPGRLDPFTLLIQSDNQWADAHLEDPQDDVLSTLIEAGSDLLGVDLSGAAHQVLHRWRYASTSCAAGLPFLIDEAQHLAACGDWCLGGKVEAAFSSANALADAILSPSEA